MFLAVLSVTVVAWTLVMRPYCTRTCASAASGRNSAATAATEIALKR